MRCKIYNQLEYYGYKSGEVLPESGIRLSTNIHWPVFYHCEIGKPTPEKQAYESV